MRQVWSDQTRIQHYLDVEKALSIAQGKLGVVPKEAADEIARTAMRRRWILES